MPVVPQPNASGVVRTLGFAFDFGEAFASACVEQGVPSETGYATLAASLGTSDDLYPAQATAWGRANQAYAEGGSGGLPAGTTPGSWLSYNGTDWIEGGSAGNIKLGYNAGLSGQEEICVAIGENAGRTGQQAGAIAIGFDAGRTNQGGYSIAIGNQTGVDNQPANTIVLNASGGALNAAQAGGMYVNPIRNVNGQANWLTYNSTSGEITFDTLLSTSLGSSNDVPSFTTSAWAYAKQANETGLAARDEASNANTFNTNYTTPNAVGVAGNSGDTPSLATSLWAYAKQAEVDAQSALSKTLFNTLTSETSVFTPAVRAMDGNSAILLPNIGVDGVNTLKINTFANAITISAGEATGGGTLRPLTLTGSHLIVQSDGALGSTGQVLGSDGTGKVVWQFVPGNVGNSTDSASLTDTLWAYAKQAEIDAQTGIANALKAVSYNLTGTAINATITNRGTGGGNAFPATTFTLATSITFNIPPDWGATDNVYLDGWVLYNFQNTFNTYWGASYTTNTYATPTDILGSTTVIGDAIVFLNSSQVYIPVNLIIPPTHLTAGGTINISFYGYVTVGTAHFSVAPVVAGRVGLALN